MNRNADEAVRRAAEKAAVDPVTVVRKKRVVEAENEIINCASQTVGRTIGGKMVLPTKN